MLYAALNAASGNLLTFEFPIIAPILLYAQELLVAFIQALVFPLLVAIFIKVAKVH
jgi:F0F1-type ATP synthase membrane subunit a